MSGRIPPPGSSGRRRYRRDRPRPRTGRPGGAQYPAIITLWRRSRAKLMPFLDHDVEIRRSSALQTRSSPATGTPCRPGAISRPSSRLQMRLPCPGLRRGAATLDAGSAVQAGLRRGEQAGSHRARRPYDPRRLTRRGKAEPQQGAAGYLRGIKNEFRATGRGQTGTVLRANQVAAHPVVAAPPLMTGGGPRQGWCHDHADAVSAKLCLQALRIDHLPDCHLHRSARAGHAPRCQGR